MRKVPLRGAGTAKTALTTPQKPKQKINKKPNELQTRFGTIAVSKQTEKNRIYQLPVYVCHVCSGTIIISIIRLLTLNFFLFVKRGRATARRFFRTLQLRRISRALCQKYGTQKVFEDFSCVRPDEGQCYGN